MRRAGLDYHEYAGVTLHEDWGEFSRRVGQSRLFGVSTKGHHHYSAVSYQEGDFLVFGPESRGLPDSIRSELGPDRLLRIPMLGDSRSLNLSNAAAVIVYEAWRQLGFANGN